MSRLLREALMPPACMRVLRRVGVAGQGSSCILNSKEPALIASCCEPLGCSPVLLHVISAWPVRWLVDGLWRTDDKLVEVKLRGSVKQTSYKPVHRTHCHSIFLVTPDAAEIALYFVLTSIEVPKLRQVKRTVITEQGPRPAAAILASWDLGLPVRGRA